MEIPTGRTWRCDFHTGNQQLCVGETQHDAEIRQRCVGEICGKAAKVGRQGHARSPHQGHESSVGKEQMSTKTFEECVDKVAKQIKHVEVAVTNVRGAAVLARGHQASLDVDLLTVCLTHMTGMLRGLRTLQAIHTSILIDGIQNDQNEKERNEKDEKVQLKEKIQIYWDDLIKTLGGEFSMEIRDSMELAFQLLQMALEKEGSEPIHCKVVLDEIRNPNENNKKDKSPKGSTCREAVARESIEDILEVFPQCTEFRSVKWDSSLRPSQSVDSMDLRQRRPARDHRLCEGQQHPREVGWFHPFEPRGNDLSP